MTRGNSWLLVAVALAAGSLRADEGSPEKKYPELVSGPVAGTAVPAARVYAASGPLAGLEFDARNLIGNRPGVLLFVHKLTRNTAPMIRAVDDLALQYGVTGLQAFTIVLAADRNAAEAQVARSSKAMRLVRPMVVSLDGADGPGGYALNRRCTLTLVLCRDGKVERSVAYTDTGRADIEPLRKMVESIAGKVPKNRRELSLLVEKRLPVEIDKLREEAARLALEAHMLRLQLIETRREAQDRRMRGRRMERGRGRVAARDGRRDRPRRNFKGKAPDDPRLRSLLRSVVNNSAGEEQISAAFAEIETVCAKDAELRRQSVEMFRLMLDLGYGTDHAKARAREYMKVHDKQ